MQYNTIYFPVSVVFKFVLNLCFYNFHVYFLDCKFICVFNLNIKNKIKYYYLNLLTHFRL